MRNTFFTTLLAMVVIATFSTSVRAALMPPISADGNIWLQPLDFVNFTWNEIDAVCNSASGGVCNGSLGGNILTGWTWAGIDEANSLFNSYIGTDELGRGGNPYDNGDLYEEFESSWAPAWFSDGFLPTREDLIDQRKATSALLKDTYSPTGFARVAFLTDFAQGDLFPDNAVTMAVQNKAASNPITGALFFRSPPATVQSPSTMFLLVFGLLILRSRGLLTE